MVENEFEYVEYLTQRGLQNKSVYSDGRYLEAISRHLMCSNKNISQYI